MDTLQKALDLDARNANALNSLGFILAEEKLDPARAVTLCRQAVDIAPRNPAYLDSLGWALFQQGGLDEAKALFPQGAGPCAGKQGDRRAHAGAHGEAEDGFHSLTSRCPFRLRANLAGQPLNSPHAPLLRRREFQ